MGQGTSLAFLKIRARNLLAPPSLQFRVLTSQACEAL